MSFFAHCLINTVYVYHPGYSSIFKLSWVFDASSKLKQTKEKMEKLNEDSKSKHLYDRDFLCFNLMNF